MCKQHKDCSFPGRKTEAEGDTTWNGPGKGAHCPHSQPWHQVDKVLSAGSTLDCHLRQDAALPAASETRSTITALFWELMYS